MKLIITFMSIFAFAQTAHADPALELCKLLTPAEIAAFGVTPSGTPEAETVKMKKGEAGAPTDVVIQSCTVFEGSVFDGVNVNVMSFKDRTSEKQLLAWLDSVDEGDRNSGDSTEITIGAAKCHTNRVASQDTKVNGKVVATVPEQFATGCDRLLDGRNVGLEVVRTNKAKAAKPAMVAELLNKIIDRLAAKK